MGRIASGCIPREINRFRYRRKRFIANLAGVLGLDHKRSAAAPARGQIRLSKINQSQSKPIKFNESQSKSIKVMEEVKP